MKVKIKNTGKIIITGFVLMLVTALHFVPVSSHQDPCGYGSDYRIILGQFDGYNKTAKIAENGISLEEAFQYGSSCTEGNNRPKKLFVL